MPITQPKQARSERTLEKILDSCDSLLAERSFDQISMQDISREAGVSVGNLYNRFADKDALITHIIDRHQTHFLNTVSSTLAAQPSELTLKERLDHLIKIFADEIASLRPVFGTIATRVSRGQPVNEVTNEKTQDITEFLTDWIMLSQSEIPGTSKRKRCRFAVASLAFTLQFDLLMETPTRLFGTAFHEQLSLQAYRYLIIEGEHNE